MNLPTPLVTFDLWNTLLMRTCDLPARVANALRVDVRALQAVWYSRWFTSNLSIEDFLVSASSRSIDDASFSEARTLLECAHEQVAVIPGWPLRLLKSLPERGVSVALVSDCDPLTLAALKQVTMAELFGATFLSYERGSTKVDGLFTHVAASAAMRNQRWILHIGDDPERDGLALNAGCDVVVSCGESERTIANAQLSRYAR